MSVYCNFIDYKKAFDRVWHEALWAVLKKQGVDMEKTAALENVYLRAESNVQVGIHISEYFTWVR